MTGVFLLMQPLRGIYFIHIDPRVALSVSRTRDTVSATRGYDMKPLRGKIREYIREQEKLDEEQNQTEFDLD